MALKVYFFAQKWLIPDLMKAAEDCIGNIRPEDALKILGHFIGADSNISASCLEVSKLYHYAWNFLSPIKVMLQKKNFTY
jgi:hypothetical protein